MKSERIVLLWPTARPEAMNSRWIEWLDHAVDPSDVTVHVAVNTPAEKERISVLGTIVVGEDHPGACWPTYCLARDLYRTRNDDVVILATDDFQPPQRWDSFVHERLAGFDGGLLVDDGNNRGCMTIPIMTYGCLLKLNRFMVHPDYHHVYADSELTTNLKEMGLLKTVYDREFIFRHLHHGLGLTPTDEIHTRCDSFHAKDAETYRRRSALSLEERLAPWTGWPA